MLTATVRAVVMTGPGKLLELRRFALPRPEPGGAVLEMVASEVCGTDVHLHHGRLPGVPYPIIPGHINCGRILETNGPLRDVEGRSGPAASAGIAWWRRRARDARSAASTASPRAPPKASSADGRSGSA